ncbi:hypothetical protein EON68_01320 [archaeon]|nr:MAG: hypothetical protein EON68_01320 [archaeon]
MALMQAPSKGPAWTNDDENARGARAQGRSSVVRAAAAAAAGAPAGGDDDAASTDSEEYAELESTTDKAAVRGADGEEATEEAAAAAKAAARKGVSDMDFLRSKMSKQFVEDATFDGTMEAHAAVVAGEAQTAAAAPAAAAAAEEEEEEPDVGESGRLFVRNLPFTCVDEDVSAYFAKWGKVAEVKLVTDANGKCKGFGYVCRAPTRGVL